MGFGETMDEQHDRVVRCSGGKAFAVGALSATQLIRLLEAPEKLLWQNLDRPVKIDHGSLMVEAELPLGRGVLRVAHKRYRPRTRWKSLCGLFRRSRARRAWHLGQALLRRQIPTARPLAMCEPRRERFPPTSYLTTEWIEAAENLHLAGWRLASRPVRQRLKWAGHCAESLGSLIGRMHALQIAHPDLKGANLLVAGDGEQLATYLIDLDGVRIGRRVSSKRRAVDLARLAAGLEAHPWLTRTVYFRFLRAYVNQFPPGEVHWKRLWRDVTARSRRIVRRKRRRGEEIL